MGLKDMKETWSSCEEGALRLLDDKADLESATQWTGSFKRWLSKRLRIYRKLYGRRHSKNVDGSAGVEGRLQQGLAVPEDIDTEILISTMVMVIFSRHTCSLLLLTLIVLFSRFLWAFWTGGVSLEEEFNSPFPLDHPVDIFIQWGAKSDVAALPLWSNLK